MSKPWTGTSRLVDLSPPAEIIHVTERHIVEGLGFLALSGVVFDILRGVSFALTLSFPIVGDALGGQCSALQTRVSKHCIPAIC